jgi:hypothetical protein
LSGIHHIQRPYTGGNPRTPLVQYCGDIVFLFYNWYHAEIEEESVKEYIEKPLPSPTHHCYYGKTNCSRVYCAHL